MLPTLTQRAVQSCLVRCNALSAPDRVLGIQGQIGGLKPPPPDGCLRPRPPPPSSLSVRTRRLVQGPAQSAVTPARLASAPSQGFAAPPSPGPTASSPPLTSITSHRIVKKLDKDKEGICCGFSLLIPVKRGLYASRPSLLQQPSHRQLPTPHTPHTHTHTRT